MTALRPHQDDTVTPQRGWALHPSAHPHQLTHAVGTGTAVATCGIRTTVRAGTWPRPGAPWTGRPGRCPTCAKGVDGSDGS